MTDVYCPEQVTNIFQYIDFLPKWFILGGPNNGDEELSSFQSYLSKFGYRTEGMWNCSSISPYRYRRDVVFKKG